MGASSKSVRSLRIRQHIQADCKDSSFIATTDWWINAQMGHCFWLAQFAISSPGNCRAQSGSCARNFLDGCRKKCQAAIKRQALRRLLWSKSSHKPLSSWTALGISSFSSESLPVWPWAFPISAVGNRSWLWWKGEVYVQPSLWKV